MKIQTAKNSGFCFGVKRAVSIANELLSEGKPVCVMGNIINNRKVVNSLEEKGAKKVSSLSQVPEGCVLVLRSHGVEKEILQKIKEAKIDYVDATCPFVKKIHKIVENRSKDKKFLLVAGAPTHPEVVGIRSYFSGESYVFSSLSELKDILSGGEEFKGKGIMVSQTTFSVEKWSECVKFIQKHFTNIEVYDTICNVTNLRQSESEKISKVSDLVIVVGGYQSSNTNKLREICSKNTSVIHVESVEQLFLYNLKGFERIGLTAGASTPTESIESVENYVLGL